MWNWKTESIKLLHGIINIKRSMTESTSLQPATPQKYSSNSLRLDISSSIPIITKNIHINNIHSMPYIYIYIDYWLNRMSKSKSTIFKWISNQVGLHPGHPGLPTHDAIRWLRFNPIRGPWNSPSCSRWKGRRSVPWASSRCWCDLPDRFFRRKKMGKHPASILSVTVPCTMDGHLHRFIIDLH